MIQLIDHNRIAISENIYAVFQRSYAVEAKILKCDNFPPLNRSIHDLMGSETAFYGHFDQSKMQAVMELEIALNHVHIRSLTVDPDFFRQGIGSALLRFVALEFPTEKITVETGNQNQPAVDFYLNFGFVKNYVWMTDIGIEK